MWGALISAGIGLLGANQQKKAANRAADAQIQAAELQAEAAKFKPYNVTTGLGKSVFDTENNTATYELDPRLRDAQATMFDLGQQGLPTTGNPEEAAQMLFDRYQQMAAPTRERSFAALQNSQFNNGTLGLAYGATQSGLGASNPALEAYLNAQNMADQNMFLTAQDKSRDYLTSDIARSQGLFTSGIGLEAPGMDALNAGITIGGRATAANSAAANALAAGMTNAANINASAQTNYINQLAGGFTQMVGQPGFQQGMGNLGSMFGSLFGNNSPQMSNAPANNMSSSYWGR